MRKIKFRAWGRYGKWDEAGENRNFIMIDADGLAFEDYKPLCELLKNKENEEYFMQFIGECDKNGKEIYEGDIVIFGAIVQVVEWKTKRQTAYGHGDSGETLSCGFIIGGYGTRNEIEVIGNIYENPELIKTHHLTIGRI